MKKSSILVILCMIAVSIVLAAVLFETGDSEKKESPEKKLVYYKISGDHRVLAVQALKPAPELPEEGKRATGSGPAVMEKEISPGYGMESVEDEEKADMVKPAAEGKSAFSAPEDTLKKVSDGYVFDEKKEGAAEKEESRKEPEFWIYNAKEDDTLWDIAEKYYGKGGYYPVLLEHNPHVGIYDIGRGVALNILKNRDDVSEIYKRIIIRKNGHFFWRYSVAMGDTLQSIIEKYYKKGRVKSDIPDLDKNSELKPGEKIWILIE